MHAPEIGRQWRPTMLFVGIWTAVALVFSTHFRFHYMVSWGTALRWGLIDWYSWAALSALVLLLAGRCLIRPGTWLRALPVHFAGMVLVSAVQVALVILIDRLVQGPAELDFTSHFESLYAKKAGVNFIAYWAVVAAGHAWILKKRPASDADRNDTRQGEVEASERLDRILVCEHSREFFVPVEDVESFQAAGNYVQLQVGSKQHLVRRTLSSLESRLDPAKFLRISRFAIVNLDRVREIQPGFKGNYSVRLQSGASLPLTRSYRKRLKDRVGSRF